MWFKILVVVYTPSRRSRRKEFQEVPTSNLMAQIFGTHIDALNFVNVIVLYEQENDKIFIT